MVFQRWYWLYFLVLGLSQVIFGLLIGKTVAVILGLALMVVGIVIYMAKRQRS